jgi:DNA-binding transcriptional ArsR family regulator
MDTTTGPSGPSGPSELELWDLRDMLKALGDVARLQMVHVLAGVTEMRVTDLGELILINGHHISQPLISWHLRVLRKYGLVRTRRSGRVVHCSLDRARYEHCLALLRTVANEPSGQPATSRPTPVDSAGGIGGLAHS